MEVSARKKYLKELKVVAPRECDWVRERRGQETVIFIRIFLNASPSNPRGKKKHFRKTVKQINSWG